MTKIKKEIKLFSQYKMIRREKKNSANNRYRLYWGGGDNCTESEVKTRETEETKEMEYVVRVCVSASACTQIVLFSK